MGAIKLVRGILGILWVCLLALSLWLACQRQFFQQEEVSLWKIRLAPLGTESRSLGDVAVVRSGDSYDLGDLVLAGEEGSGTLLRLVGSSDGQFIGRDEATSEGEEQLLPPENIRGQVTAVLAGAGVLYGFLSSLWGPPVVFVVGLLLLGLPTLLGLGKAPKAKRARGRHSRREG